MLLMRQNNFYYKLNARMLAWILKTDTKSPFKCQDPKKDVPFEALITSQNLTKLRVYEKKN